MNKLPLTLLILLMGFSFNYTATASDINHSQTINLAGKQRMLTQKMSKEAALVALDVAKDQNLFNLKATRDLFDTTLSGLRNGNDSLGLSATKKPKILNALDTVDSLWSNLDIVMSAIIDTGTATSDQIDEIAAQNIPLLKAMNKAVKLYESAATGDDMNPALAVAINLAGRQRMLTQKMSKEFFFIVQNQGLEKNKASLSETISTFDTTLNGLINGDDSLGLSPAPTEEIEAQLTKVQSMWHDFKGHLQSEPTEETVVKIAETNLPLLKEMNKAVNLFASIGQ